MTLQLLLQNMRCCNSRATGSRITPGGSSSRDREVSGRPCEATLRRGLVKEPMHEISDGLLEALTDAYREVVFGKIGG
jgi:hypothetical protein